MSEHDTGKGYAIPNDWTFKRDDIANAFDQHVREQLPWYDLATGVVAHVGRHYLPEGGRMYDIGASTGNITNVLRDIIEGRGVKATSIEASQEMCNIWAGTGELELADCLHYDYQPFDFAVVFLVLMFLPEKKRAEFLETLYSQLEVGGAIIVFDKIAHTGGYLGNVLARLTLAGKKATGVSSDDIVSKELSLGGVQRPLNLANLPILRMYGTKIFQFGEFAGWVITKDEA